MIEITKHTDGFTFYSPTEIILLVFDSTFWYSQTKYRGHCSVGLPSTGAQATALQTQENVDSFIASNNLVKYGVPVAPFHEDTDFQVFLTHRNAARLAREHPAMAVYINEHEIEMHDEEEGVYFYVSRWEPGHQELVNQYATINEK